MLIQCAVYVFTNWRNAIGKSASMGWFIHHVNLQAHDVMEASNFYRDVIGLKDGVWAYPESVGYVGHDPETIAAFGSENRGIHLCRAIPEFPARNNLAHNPTIGGHFAINTSDVDAVKGRLEGGGYIVSDAGVYAMAGIRQIYAYDPFQNVIEVNETVDGSGGTPPGAAEAHDVRVEDGGWHLHHVQIPAHDVATTAAYFRDLIGLAAAESSGEEMNDGQAAFFGEEHRGIYIVKPSPEHGQREGYYHNPTLRPCMALGVSDLDAVRGRLDAAGVLYTDAGTDDATGLRRLYCYDPSMNLVELNQPA